MRYSEITGCFYPDDINYANLPSDLINVTDEEYAAAMARPVGYTIEVVDGAMTAAPPAAASAYQQALAQITDLERTVTPRRLREAALGTDDGWLKALDDQIAALRATIG
jgi:hypothetical protein